MNENQPDGSHHITDPAALGALDPRRLLANASLYEAFQRSVGKERLRRRFVAKYVQPRRGLRMLDVGCGPGDLLTHLPEHIDYVGCDVSEPYIDAARRRMGHRATFHLGGIEEVPVEPGSLDRIVTVGVLHHVPDDVATGIVKTALDLLAPGGRFIALEPHLYDGMHPISRALISRDRGRWVRTERAYTDLFRPTFDQPGADLAVTREERFLRVPYSLVILTGSKRPTETA